MSGTHIKYYIVEKEYNDETNIVEVLQHELESNRKFAETVFNNGREILKSCADQETFDAVIAEIYPMLYSVSTKLSVLAKIFDVKTLEDYDRFCEDFLSNKIDIVEIADTISYVLADVIFGNDKNQIKCLNLDDIRIIVEDIRNAIENPSDSLKRGNAWMSVKPSEVVTISRFLFPAYDAMKDKFDNEGLKSYLLCMPQH